MSLTITNVLTRQKEPFIPLHKGKVNLYVCGPTVYDYPHIGHAKTYIAFDVIVRYLEYLGNEVLYVQNITDVGHLLGDGDEGEDRILKKARQDSVMPMQVVETYTRVYFENMDALGVRRPDISPRASAHIPEQIDMIQTLLAKGYAYEANGSVYFDVTCKEDYGKFSGRRVDEQEEGARVTVHGDKRNPADFALWKMADPQHLLRWPSPWGEGYPGWHIECSAMAKKYLGPTFDIHGGGRDNLFPHNECEIAQSEAANGVEFARYWMLTGSLTLDGVKMSKSLGNTLTINEALYVRHWKPEAVRTFILSGHYTSPVDFSDEAMEAAGRGWQRINGAVLLVRHQQERAPDGPVSPAVRAVLDETVAAFEARMNDDFNTPGAVAILQDFTRTVNGWLNGEEPLSRDSLAAIDGLYGRLGGDVLGLVPPAGQEAEGSAAREAGLIELLLNVRGRARDNRDWATSDQIRDELRRLGIAIEDRADGTIWKIEG